MPKLDLYNMNGEVIGDIELNDNVFGVEVNTSAIHMAVTNQLANKRQGTQSTKTKSDSFHEFIQRKTPSNRKY